MRYFDGSVFEIYGFMSKFVGLLTTSDLYGATELRSCTEADGG